jgi:antitoxin VapB
METAKVFQNGKSQAVRLPKQYRFSGTEVGVSRLGELVVLYPKDRADDLFFSSLGNFTDDFFESVLAARAEQIPDSPRERL